jgi:hypothetical protein
VRTYHQQTLLRAIKMSPKAHSLVIVVTIGGLMTWSVDRLLKYRKLVVQSGGQPTIYMFFGIASYVKATYAADQNNSLTGLSRAFGQMLPRIPYISPGTNYSWSTKRYCSCWCSRPPAAHLLSLIAGFEQLGADVYNIASMSPLGNSFMVADPEVMKVGYVSSYLSCMFRNNTSSASVVYTRCFH